MKNEPVVTYNHMEEDDASANSGHAERGSDHLPISLYMILVVDAILVSLVVFFSFKIIY